MFNSIYLMLNARVRSASYSPDRSACLWYHHWYATEYFKYDTRKSQDRVCYVPQFVTSFCTLGRNIMAKYDTAYMSKWYESDCMRYHIVWAKGGQIFNWWLYFCCRCGVCRKQMELKFGPQWYSVILESISLIYFVMTIVLYYY